MQVRAFEIGNPIDNYHSPGAVTGGKLTLFILKSYLENANSSWQEHSEQSC